MELNRRDLKEPIDLMELKAAAVRAAAEKAVAEKTAAEKASADNAAAVVAEASAEMPRSNRETNHKTKDKKRSGRRGV